MMGIIRMITFFFEHQTLLYFLCYDMVLTAVSLIPLRVPRLKEVKQFV